MKHALYPILLGLFLTCSVDLSAGSLEPNSSERLHRIASPALDLNGTEAYSEALDKKKVRTGKKLRFAERLALKWATKRLNKKLERQARRAKKAKPERTMGSGLGIAGMVLGILGLFIPFLGIIALILGIIGLKKDDQKGFAIAAVILGSLAVLFMIIALIVIIGGGSFWFI